MDFDPQKKEFVLTADEQAVFRADTHEWSLADADTLIDHIALAENDLANCYPTTMSPAERRQAVSEFARKAELVRKARQVVAKHAVLSETDFDQLLNQ